MVSFVSPILGKLRWFVIASSFANQRSYGRASALVISTTRYSSAQKIHLNVSLLSGSTAKVETMATSATAAGDVMTKPKLIIDCDAGVDDAMALIIALDRVRKGFADILAVTCTHGNTTVDNVAVNVLRVLDSMNLPNIPVYKGANMPLLEPYVRDSPPFHGTDGFGDAQWETTPDASARVSREHASLAMIRLVNEHPGEITLVPTGPLTNVALAMKLDEGFLDKLKDVFIMGGNLRGRGNITTCAEFNFHCDPEAALIVLNGSQKPPTLFTLDLCVEAAPFSFDWRKSILGAMSSPQAQLMNRVEEKTLLKHSECYETYAMWDQLPVAAALDRDLILGSSTWNATVELSGRHTRGQMVVESRHRAKGTRRENVIIVDKVDRDAFESMLLDAFRQ